MTYQDRFEKLAQALYETSRRVRRWKNLSDGEQRIWRSRARVVLNSAHQAWPTDFPDAKHAMSSHETQAANGMLELRPGRRTKVVKGRTREVAVTENVRASPLSWYRSRDHISDQQAAAGAWLYRTFYAAGLTGVACIDLQADRVDSTKRSGTTDQQADAMSSLRAAERAVGDDLWPVLRAVCCEEVSAQDWAKRARLARPEATGLVVLRLALSTLQRWIDGQREAA